MEYFKFIFIKTYLMQMRKVLKNEFLTRKTIKHLMNKIFSTNTEKNEKDMQNFRKEYNL